MPGFTVQLRDKRPDDLETIFLEGVQDKLMVAYLQIRSKYPHYGFAKKAVYVTLIFQQKFENKIVS